MWLRPNREIASYAEALRYARTIDGYGYDHEHGWRKTHETPVPRMWEFERPDGSWVGTFEDLRVCLYMLHRVMRHAEDDEVEYYDRWARLYASVCDAWDREYELHPDEIQAAHDIAERHLEAVRKWRIDN